MTSKLQILLIFSILCYALLLPAFTATSSPKALDTLIESVSQYKSSEYAFNQQNITTTVAEFNKLLSEKIKPPKSRDFESLQRKSQKLAYLLIDVSKRFVSETNNINFIISLCDVYYQTLAELQLQIQTGFEKFDWQDRLSNNIPYVQSRTALDHSKTSLLAMVATELSKANNQADKKDCWAIIHKMIDQTHIRVSEIGPVISELHSLVILLKLNKITEYIESNYSDEIDEEIKTFTVETMEKIHSRQIEFGEQIEEVKRKGREFESQFLMAREYAGVEEDVTPEEIKTGLNANEWFQKGYYAEDCSEKIKNFSKALEIEPAFLPALINRGVCYDQFQLYENAIRDYTSALEIDPRHALAYNYRGMSYNSVGKTAEAIQDFNKSIECDSLFVLAYVNRGMNYRQLGKYRPAISDFSKAIALEPQNAQVYVRRGTSYINLKKYKQAVQDFTKAIELKPDYALAYYNLGYAYWELRKWQEVVNSWEKCLELDPSQTKLLEHLEYARHNARLTKKRKSNK